MKSVFTDKNVQPTSADLKKALSDTFDIWHNFVDFTFQNYPDAVAEWHYSGEKFGWSFRIKDTKRVLVYLLPRAGFFKTAFVFGQKATDQIMQSPVSDAIKTELQAAKVYAEGRGIRIDIKNNSVVKDIHELIKFKILN